MIQKTFFKEMDRMTDDLINDLETVSTQSRDWISVCEASLMKIDQAVRTVKSMVVGYTFETTADEIHFFRKIKPFFISKFIFFTRVLHIESYRPAAGHKALKKYYEDEQDKLKIFFKEHADFCSYFRRKATYLDHKYFVRDAFDMKMKLSLSFYNLDAGFTTSHDQYIAHIMANKDLETYINSEIKKIGTADRTGGEYKSPLSWSSSKASLIELMYGLYMMRCFNGGNIDLSEVIRTFEKMFEVDLGNFHKILGEVKGRKINRTKFLQSMHQNLEQHFSDLDGK